MIDLQNLNGYGLEAPSLSQLREIAKKYCPEEVKEFRQSILPDESLHLEELEAGFQALLHGGSAFPDLPYIGDGAV